MDTDYSTLQDLGFSVWCTVISYQDKDTTCRTNGIWPYYAEESQQGKFKVEFSK